MSNYILGSASTLLIFFMASLYFGVIIADVFNAPFLFSLAFPVFFLLLQYIIFPLLLNKIFIKIQYVNKNEKISLFEKHLSSKKNVEIIFWDTPYPIIFHFGSIFTSTKCVVSLGLLDILSDEEIFETAKIELSKIEIGARHVFMSTGLLPFCLFHISQYLDFLGTKHKVVGGAGSIVSFAAFLSLLARISYIPLYFSSRNTNKFSYSKLENLEFLNKISKGKEMLLPQKITDLVFSLNFLDIFDPSIPFRKSKNYHFCDYKSNMWKDYIDLFHSHELPNSAIDKKYVFNDYGFTILIAAAIALLLSAISYNFNFYTSYFLTAFGLLLLTLHMYQRPFSKIKETFKEIVAKEAPSPLKGFYTKIKGNISRATVTAVGERLFSVNTGNYVIPLTFFSVNKPNLAIEDNEELELTGYIRQSEVLEFEPVSIKKGTSSIYASNSQILLVAFDLLLIVLNLMIVIFHYKGG